MVAVQPDHAPRPGSPSKWDLLKALTSAAEEFELTHRTLNVLRALLSFLPGTEIPQEPCAATVFPANRTLSARLNGMPESTLRRHLSRLVTLGIVNRHDSPNRKRYARKTGQGVALAFGFDLSPLIIHADHILASAERAAERQHHMAVLRDRVALLRQQLLDLAGQDATDPLIEDARLILRRKPELRELTRIHDALQQAINRQGPVDNLSRPAFCSTGSSARDARNGRHIQESNKPISDSERAEGTDHPAGPAMAETDQDAKKNTEPTLHQVLAACHELRTFFPDPIRDWRQLQAIADRLAPMLNIDQPVMQDAKHRMGPRQAALAVICILERNASIHRPGAYLRRLAQKAEAGTFSILPMLNALLRQQKTTDCQLAI